MGVHRATAVATHLHVEKETTSVYRARVTSQPTLPVIELQHSYFLIYMPIQGRWSVDDLAHLPAVQVELSLLRFSPLHELHKGITLRAMERNTSSVSANAQASAAWEIPEGKEIKRSQPILVRKILIFVGSTAAANRQ